MAKRYKKNFLKQVFVRVDFQKPLENYEKGLLPQVEKDIKKTFPTLVEDKIKQQAVEFESGQTKVLTIDHTLWHYYAKNKKKHTRIEPTVFFIQYDKYYSFERLEKDFKLVCGSLIKNYNELNIIRIGLRYIDEIEIKKEQDVFGWKKYLKPKLFSALSLPPIKDKKFISRAFSNLELHYKDHNLILKYGMFNPDYPSTIRKKNFILDSDAYKRDNIQNEDIYSVLKQLHKTISYWFENRLIASGLRSMMNER